MIGNFAALFTPLINAARLAAWPVGSIYMSMNATSPGALFGGTWERIAYGRMLIGADGSSYPVGSMGGEAAHALTEAEMPAHAHAEILYFTGGQDTSLYAYHTYASYNPESSLALSGYTGQTGGGTPHNNMPPYLAVYMWKRTA